ncbi:MAG: hypothetical protein IPF55_15195 [Rhodoferax sp.]|nr:hypothetical protein [Rhodoferax sp.]
MNDAQLKARDAGRDMGAELLQAVRELPARKTTFEFLADGNLRRTVLRADGSAERQSVLVAPYEVCSNR